MSASSSPRAHRGTIAIEDGRVLNHEHLAAGQHVLRLAAPQVAATALAGSFVHLQCNAAIRMRRPLSIMRVDREAGWIEVLYKVVGHGLAELTKSETGDTLSVMGPIGRGFSAHPERRRVLAIGGGVGIPPMVFLASELRAVMDRLGADSLEKLVRSLTSFRASSKPTSVPAVSRDVCVRSFASATRLAILPHTSSSINAQG